MDEETPEQPKEELKIDGKTFEERFPPAPMTEKEYREYIFKMVDRVETKEDLIKLITHIETFPHDYGSIVVGIAAAMKATFRVVDRGEGGGITGAQAGFIAHEMISEFMCIQPPYRIVHGEEYQRLFPKKETK